MATSGLLPLNVAARRLRVSDSTLRNWFDRKLINGFRLPTGARRIPESEVERLEREMFAMPTSFAPTKVNASPKVSRREVPQGDYPDF